MIEQNSAVKFGKNCLNFVGIAIKRSDVKQATPIPDPLFV
jgi:hypothetical protein